MGTVLPATPKDSRSMAPRAATPRLPAQPTHEEIALHAFELSQQRGDGPGSPEEDWLQAERELRLRDALRRR